MTIVAAIVVGPSIIIRCAEAIFITGLWQTFLLHLYIFFILFVLFLYAFSLSHEVEQFFFRIVWENDSMLVVWVRKKQLWYFYGSLRSRQHAYFKRYACTFFLSTHFFLSVPSKLVEYMPIYAFLSYSDSTIKQINIHVHLINFGSSWIEFLSNNGKFCENKIDKISNWYLKKNVIYFGL